MDIIEKILTDTLYLLALINPVSKIAVISVLSSGKNNHEEFPVIIKSSLIALGILLCGVLFGDVILRNIFHVNLHSLRISGGIVLLWIGFNALRKGMFFEKDTEAKFSDLAIVPLACPMIAGPATIAASITMSSSGKEHIWMLVAALLSALAVNFILMLFAKPIGSLLYRFNILGALIRITGLVVMTVGVEMVLEGIKIWEKSSV